MKNTIVYIDGYNLYYGLLKGTSYKWLDLVRFAKELVGLEHNVIAVKYFTSWVKPHPYDASYYKNIPRDLPARCQLPDVISIGTHGNILRRPAAWR